MQDDLQTFFEHPSSRNYRRARHAILRDGDGRADEADLHELARLCEQGFFVAACEHAAAMMPAWALSPRVHFLAALAAEQRDDSEDVELERFMLAGCLEGLLDTGDGTSRHPYLVSHLADEKDILASLDLHAQVQTLVELGSRRCDVVQCRDGSEIWFDVSAIIKPTRSGKSRPKRSPVLSSGKVARSPAPRAV